MGVGKTSCARYLGDLLGCGFTDLDSEIHKASGMTSGQYIRHLGEASFRQYEMITLQNLLTNPPKIIALGGGTLHIDGVLDMLLHTCLIVIDSSYEQIKLRISNTDRPLANSGRPLYEKRGWLFKTMPMMVDSTHLTIPQCSLKIYNLWNRYEST